MPITNSWIYRIESWLRHNARDFIDPFNPFPEILDPVARGLVLDFRSKLDHMRSIWLKEEALLCWIIYTPFLSKIVSHLEERRLEEKQKQIYSCK